MRTSVDVHNFLVERDVPHEVFLTRGRLRTPERIAAILELPPEEVGKVVIFEGDGGAVAAVVPAGSEVDPQRLARVASRSDLRPATLERTIELTGYLPESLPPVGLPAEIDVVVDRSLDRRSRVLYFPGGDVRVVLKIRGGDLLRSTGARVGSIRTRPRPGSAGARSRTA